MNLRPVETTPRARRAEPRSALDASTRARSNTSDAATDSIEGLQAKFRLKVCNPCDYEIRENYIRQNRLCFPTVGIRASGKTHWMIMLYDRSRTPTSRSPRPSGRSPRARTRGSTSCVRRLLYEGGRLDPTALGLPYPLTFHVHDADPLGPNKTMVNLFDFSGEMRNFTIDQSEFRRRALLCEGFTLFLDPTQVSRTRLPGSDLTIEDQIQTLAQFAEEMHAIRGLAAENPIDMPIAICVSKMDLARDQERHGDAGHPPGERAAGDADARRSTCR